MAVRDISSEVLEGARAGAGRLDMHAPILAPDGGIGLPAVDVHPTAQVLSEGGLEMIQIDQEVRLFDAHGLAESIETGTRNQAMDVGMKFHALVPGVQERGEPVDVSAQPFGRGQLF